MIITIIVLLILAGVTLTTLIGEGSIIGNAKNVVGKYNNSVIEEQMLLNEIEKYFGNNGDGEGGETTGPDGSEENPYLIEYIEDLIDLSIAVKNQETEKYDGKYFKLTRDLDFNNTTSYRNANNTSYGDLNTVNGVQTIMEELTDTTEGATGFRPIGGDEEESIKFTGNLLGNNNSIENIYMFSPNYSLIRELEGEISDLTITGSVVGDQLQKDSEGNTRFIEAGGIVAINNGAIINCISDIEYTNDIGIAITTTTGGIAAINNGTIMNCMNIGKTIHNRGAQRCYGGIVCVNNGIIDNCVNSCDIYVDISGGEFGGIVVTNSGTIINCYNMANITAYTEGGGGAAGIAMTNKSEGIISNCYNAGNIIVDWSGSGITETNVGIVRNSYNKGSVGYYLFDNDIKLLYDIESVESAVRIIKTYTIEAIHSDKDLETFMNTLKTNLSDMGYNEQEINEMLNQEILQEDIIILYELLLGIGLTDEEANLIINRNISAVQKIYLLNRYGYDQLPCLGLIPCCAGIVRTDSLWPFETENVKSIIENCYNEGKTESGIISAVYNTVELINCGYLEENSYSGVGTVDSQATVIGEAQALTEMPDKLSILNAGGTDAWEYDENGEPVLKIFNK